MGNRYVPLDRIETISLSILPTESLGLHDNVMSYFGDFNHRLRLIFSVRSIGDGIPRESQDFPSTLNYWFGWPSKNVYAYSNTPESKTNIKIAFGLLDTAVILFVVKYSRLKHFHKSHSHHCKINTRPPCVALIANVSEVEKFPATSSS